MTFVLKPRFAALLSGDAVTQVNEAMNRVADVRTADGQPVTAHLPLERHLFDLVESPKDNDEP